MSIKAGDLVMIVRPSPCCIKPDAMGYIFTAGRVVHSDTTCLTCGHYNGPQSVVEFEPDHFVEESRLIKIDPNALKDDVPEKEEIHA